MPVIIEPDKPAKVVKSDGLPENVVPITRGSKSIECTFASDLKEYIQRSHQSYYTCLSRSATASGTVIVQSFFSVFETGSL
jgi:hypothetical protein